MPEKTPNYPPTTLSSIFPHLYSNSVCIPSYNYDANSLHNDLNQPLHMEEDFDDLR